MSPGEARLLEGYPQPLDRCPLCGAEPFRAFLRGQVHRDMFSPWRALLRLLGRTRPHCAVICSECRFVVAWETPTEPGCELAGEPMTVRKGAIFGMSTILMTLGVMVWSRVAKVCGVPWFVHLPVCACIGYASGKLARWAADRL